MRGIFLLFFIVLGVFAGPYAEMRDIVRYQLKRMYPDAKEREQALRGAYQDYKSSFEDLVERYAVDMIEEESEYWKAMDDQDLLEDYVDLLREEEEVLMLNQNGYVELVDEDVFRAQPI